MQMSMAAWQKMTIEIKHANTPAKLFGSHGLWEVSDRYNFLRQKEPLSWKSQNQGRSLAQCQLCTLLG